MSLTMTPVLERALEKPADTTYPIHELLAKRWSPWAYASAPISPETLGSLMEAARWSPSSMNEQPWRFIVVDKAADPQAHARLVGVLMEGNQAWAKDAPVLILAVAAMRLTRNGNPNGKALYDLGQAVAHMTVEATAHGLVMRQMGGFHKDQAAEAFGIPEGYEPVVTLAMGYPGHPDALPEPLRQRQSSPRSRKPLADLVFAGKWGESTTFSRN